jgi:hypothetical protein
MKLTHFYHVYADGDWETPAYEHIEELFISGLLDELDNMFIGIVGSKENRDKVKRNFAGVVVAEADEGWEQVTLSEVLKFAEYSSDAIFYAHTKGAWSNTPLAKDWRESMTHDTVTRWQECVSSLRDHDAAGAFWLKSVEPEHHDHDFFFAGNFWWATANYVRSLAPVKTENRFQAEGWIGLGKPTVKVMREGFPTWGNFWEP